MGEASQARFFTSSDGLRLHYRECLPEGETSLAPAVCLPGLTRSAGDFAVLAQALAGSTAAPRRVLAFDYRGRGLSDHDPDWRHYDLGTERADLLAGLRHAGISAAHFVGTSRGGLHLMALAGENRALMRGIVLNDIGPVLEPDGLARIKGYVGRPAAPRTTDEAIDLLRRGAGRDFDGLDDAGWLHFVRTTFGEDPEDLRLRYDFQLAHTLDGLDLEKPLPDMWSQFDALRGLPLLVVRGANSDLLSPATFTTMVGRWPGCRGHVVSGQGHAPLLADAPTIGVIHDFLIEADRAG